MNHQIASKKLLALRQADEDLRKKLLQEGKLNDGYHYKMEALHNANADALEHIIKAIGFPSLDKVGQGASEAAWLIAQHAIGKPSFMRYFASQMEKAVEEGAADPILLAYLHDRISILEGRPQQYGTQFDWDENGALSPQNIDNKESVNRNRKAIGLNSLEEQTTVMRARVKKENQSPPKNLKKRKIEMEEWRKKVGWITSD